MVLVPRAGNYLLEDAKRVVDGGDRGRVAADACGRNAFERARARGVEAVYSEADRRAAGDHARDRDDLIADSTDVKDHRLGYWTNKVVMITGASSGIGRGVALEIAARGAHLGLLARREELLNEIVDEARAHNVKAVAAAADVRDAKAVRAAADRFRNELGPIDILIANAGIGTADHALQLDAGTCRKSYRNQCAGRGEQRCGSCSGDG